MILFALACIKGNTEDSDSQPTGSEGDDSAALDGRIHFETTLGDFDVMLDEENAPITSANFLTYVEEGFFDGQDGFGATTFHRVIPGFMAQGGGYTPEDGEKETHAAIELESDNGLSNTRGTIAMARTNVPDSATSQFFINVVDNTFLDYAGEGNPGYAVFGEVIEGMDVVDAIVSVDTNASDKPREDIVITLCERR